VTDFSVIEQEARLTDSMAADTAAAIFLNIGAPFGQFFLNYTTVTADFQELSDT
jgi:hypothetical protein